MVINENDLYTLYETEKVFGELIQNTDFTNYLKYISLSLNLK